MSDVWPPPPKNQPAPEPPSILPSGGFGAILCVSAGAMMLISATVVSCAFDFAQWKASSAVEAFFGKLMLAGLMLTPIGTWAAYQTRNTRNGRAALLVACATVITFGSLLLLPVLYRYF
jgi:hypothetical protein